MEKCTCGSSRLAPGEIRSTGKVYFRPDKGKFLTLRTANVPVRASICLDCGRIELTSDRSKVEALLKK